jgi:dihydrofolate reductase
MGRRSWETFGADLTSAHNVVISRTVAALSGAVVVDGLDAALETARAFGRTVYCAGGASVYTAALPLADAMYLSWIDGSFTGDARFPRFDPDAWLVARRERHARFEFVEYRRRSRPERQPA